MCYDVKLRSVHLAQILQKSVQCKPSYSMRTDMTKPTLARYNNVTKHQHSLCANCMHYGALEFQHKLNTLQSHKASDMGRLFGTT
jgi:hypothetical protein